MSSENKISVIVPVYNLQDYIERCARSILFQTYKNIEVVLVDDGSSDNSREVISKIASSDSRVVPIFKENGGVTSARLVGVEKATGDWIGFVDGDDEIESDMYELLLNNAIKYNADISHCGYQMIFADGRINYFHNSGRLVKQDKTKGLQDLLDGSLVEPGLCNKLFHKTLIKSLLHTDIMDTSIKNNEDLLMNYILFSQSEMSVFEDVCKYHYIIRQNSASRRKKNEHTIYDPVRVKEIILDMSDNSMQEAAKRAYLSTCIYVYCGLALSGKEYAADRIVIREKIVANKNDFLILSKKTRLLASLITYIPSVFPFAYGIYSKYFQEKRYE